MSISPNAALRLERERAAQPLGARRVLEDEHLLQEDRRAQAGAEDEMPFEQRAGGAEFGEGLFGGEFVLSLSCPLHSRAIGARRKPCARRGASQALWRTVANRSPPRHAAFADQALGPKARRGRARRHRGAAADRARGRQLRPFRTARRRGLARRRAPHGRGNLVFRRRARRRSGAAWATRRASSTSGPGVSLTIPLGTHFQFRAEPRRPARLRRRHHAALAGRGGGVPRRRPLASTVP